MGLGMGAGFGMMMPGMIQQAMAQDYSWDRSAEEYVAAYQRAIANKAAL